MNEQANDASRHAHLAGYWLAAVRAKYAVAADWLAWADKAIQTSPNPASWIIDLSVAKDHDAALGILEPWVTQELGDPAPDVDDAAIGFMWLRFERGDFTLAECLRGAAQYADAYDTAIECEDAYALLSRQERDHRVEQEARSLFADARAKALAQWRQLMHLALPPP